MCHEKNGGNVWMSDGIRRIIREELELMKLRDELKEITNDINVEMRKKVMFELDHGEPSPHVYK